jgi:hypothetical protein
LKNSFQGISTTKFVRKLLNVRSLEGPKFTEITALVPLSTPTGDYTNRELASPSLRAEQVPTHPAVNSGG